MSIRKTWGRNIREQRVAAGLTQYQLADRVGVSQKAVAAWETGVNAPTVDHQVAVANALGASPRLLFPYPETA